MRREPFVLGVLSMALGSSTARGQLVNGGFECPIAPPGPGDFLTIGVGAEAASGFSGWVVEAGNVDTVDATAILFGINWGAEGSIDGEQVLDLNGTTSGTISQAFATVNGQSYVLRFWYTNNPLNESNESAQVTLQDVGTTDATLLSQTIVHTNATLTVPDWVMFEQTFVAQGGSTRLRFASLSGGASGGIVLDAVSVSEPVVGGVTIVSANPPLDNPYVDGQQPYRDVLDTGPGTTLSAGIGGAGTQPQGGISYAPISVTFSGLPSPAPSPENIQVACCGSACPTVTAVSGSGAGPYSVTLSGPIPPSQCTTLTFAGTAAGVKLQYQSQPGNVSMDAITNTQDLLTLVQALNNGTANQAGNLARFNVNRSAGGSPVNTQDLLRIIQLLNGTLTTQAFNGAGVAGCL